MIVNFQNTSAAPRKYEDWPTSKGQGKSRPVTNKWSGRLYTHNSIFYDTHASCNSRFWQEEYITATGNLTFFKSSYLRNKMCESLLCSHQGNTWSDHKPNAPAGKNLPEKSAYNKAKSSKRSQLSRLKTPFFIQLSRLDITFRYVFYYLDILYNHVTLTLTKQCVMNQITIWFYQLAW